MTKFIYLFALLSIFSCSKKVQPGTPTGTVDVQSSAHSIYEYTVQDIYGNPFPLSQLKGKKVMIVNTASKCGNTPQYGQLEEIYKKYKDQNFTIIGFPSNDFNGQEPGSNEEIIQFCEANYGVTFPMMSKIDVKGPDMAPLYHYLTEYDLNGVENNEVQWNFQKYLIDESGHLIKVISPKTQPKDAQIIDWIEGKDFE